MTHEVAQRGQFGFIPLNLLVRQIVKIYQNIYNNTQVDHLVAHVNSFFKMIRLRGKLEGFSWSSLSFYVVGRQLAEYDANCSYPSSSNTHTNEYGMSLLTKQQNKYANSFAIFCLFTFITACGDGPIAEGVTSQLVQTSETQDVVESSLTLNEEFQPAAAIETGRSLASIAPDSGSLLGANVEKGEQDTRYDAVVVFEDLLNRNIAIINRFHEFSAGLDSSFFWDRRHIEDGRTVMISWRATDNPGSVNGEPDPRRAIKIVAGEFDREIEAMATALSDLGAPILLRFNWEMDQDHGDPQYIGTPSEFIDVWRYVHDIFKERGVTNVEWVWAPRARSFAKEIGQAFYPGDNYVDWIGGSSVPINSFTDAQTIYGEWNEWASSLGKPQLLWIGLRENPDDLSWKADFIEELRQLTTNTWHGVKAIVYYNSNSPLGYDYRIGTSPQSLSAFRALACDPHYLRTENC